MATQTQTEQQVFTLDEALAQGYQYFHEQYDDQVHQLSDVKAGHLDYKGNGKTYFLYGKEPMVYTISASEIQDAIAGIAEGQEEMADEDGDLMEIINEIDVQEFEPLAELINKRLAVKQYFPPTSLQVIF